MWVLVRKEIRELSRERIVLIGLFLGPLIMYLLLGGSIVLTMGKLGEGIEPSLSYCITVQGEPSEHVKDLASRLGAVIIRTDSAPPDRPLSLCDVTIRVPPDFDELVDRGSSVPLEIVIRADSTSYYELGKAQTIKKHVEVAVLDLIAARVKGELPNATGETLSNPASLTFIFEYRGYNLDIERFTGLIVTSSIIIPLAVLIVTLAATQVAAISIGIEKEDRTLETLISLPIRFTNLVSAKIVAVTILSLGER